MTNKLPICCICKKEILPDMKIHYVGSFDKNGKEKAEMKPMCNECYHKQIWMGKK